MSDEAKDSAQPPINQIPKDIGGYPVISGPLESKASSSKVFFVDTSGGNGISGQEGAAKVGENTPDAIGYFRNEAKLQEAAIGTLSQNRRDVIPEVIDSPSAPLLDKDGNVTEHAVLVTKKIGEGANLGDLIIQNGELSVPETFKRLFPVALALDDIRKTGIIHRDLKPENIFLDSNGNAKLADFGAAVTAGHLSNMLIGTPGYLAPEHARADIATDKTNIWGFGAVVFYSLTALPLMDPNTLKNPAYFYSREDYEKYTGERMKGLSPAIQKVIQKATAFDPGDRYKSCTEFLLELEHADNDSSSESLSEKAAHMSKTLKNKLTLKRVIQRPPRRQPAHALPTKK